MRLAVSNLAWPAPQDDAAFRLLTSLGVQGVEVAPTKLAPWNALTATQLSEFRSRLAAAGLVVSSLQAILYGLDQPQLLGDERQFLLMRDHVKKVADIGAQLGGQALVFGSPRNRVRGAGADRDIWRIARDRLRILAETAAAGGTIIGIEPVPAAYGGDFLGSWRDVLKMVQDVDHAGVRVHLDTACVMLGGDSIGEAVTATKDWLAHFHAAEPQLAPFDAPVSDHRAAAAALKAAHYDKWISIEMREQPDDPLAAVSKAVRAVQRLYSL
jgi:sugar phosphate isomerase/epimerase